MNFYKYQGAGNDFVIIGNMDLAIGDLSSLAARVCDRRYGVGADGFIAAEPSDQADVRMAFYNADGSVAGMCGNGIRCFAKFVFDTGIVRDDSFSVETGDGVRQLTITQSSPYESRVRVNMGAAGEIRRFAVPVDPEKIRTGDGDVVTSMDVAFTHLGVPHAVIVCEEPDAGMRELDTLAETYGDFLEHAPAFGEAHTNVNFIKVEDSGHVLCSTWERGAGKTLACGTGACSSAYVASRFFGCGGEVQVTMPGGQVTVTRTDGEVFMEGSAVMTFTGSLPE